jgi:hypothetical protein
MTQHVILAYGRETELWRATFAVLSFYAWYEGDRADVHTVVFTDKPDFFAPYFKGLPVDYSLLTPEGLEEMRGPQQYIHRVKPMIIAQVLRDHPADNLLFCDSDTFFITKADQLLAAIKPTVSVMHVREFTFAEAVNTYAGFTPANQDRFPRKLIELIESRTFPVDSVERQFHRKQYIWNSGVLGLSSEVGKLMPDICALNDAFFKGSEWFTSEQIAFSMALPIKTTVVPSDQYIFHYWGQHQKVLMDGLLTQLDSAGFRSLPLAARLEQAKSLTMKWQQEVKADLAREGALYALANDKLIAGLKCAAKALLASPLDATFTKNLLSLFRKRILS